MSRTSPKPPIGRPRYVQPNACAASKSSGMPCSSRDGSQPVDIAGPSPQVNTQDGGRLRCDQACHLLRIERVRRWHRRRRRRVAGHARRRREPYAMNVYDGNDHFAVESHGPQRQLDRRRSVRDREAVFRPVSAARRCSNSWTNGPPLVRQPESSTPAIRSSTPACPEDWAGRRATARRKRADGRRSPASRTF